MSLYIELHNFIKIHACLDWLTLSQQQALTAIQNALRTFHVINLHGVSGCGKTFLGWVCHHESIGAYLPHPRLLRDNMPSPLPSCLIIDNTPTRRAEFRHILKEIQIHKIPNLIAISREPIREEVAAIELHCTEHDCKGGIHNLSLADRQPKVDTDTNLWEIFDFKCKT